jgi:hypothetical protein
MNIVNKELEANDYVRELLATSTSLHGEKWANVMKQILSLTPIEFNCFDRLLSPLNVETEQDLDNSIGAYTFKFENGTFFGKIDAPWIAPSMRPRISAWRKIPDNQLPGILVEARLVEEYDLTLYNACIEALKEKKE